LVVKGAIAGARGNNEALLPLRFRRKSPEIIFVAQVQLIAKPLIAVAFSDLG